jgi:hypothetical protein
LATMSFSDPNMYGRDIIGVLLRDVPAADIKEALNAGRHVFLTKYMPTERLQKACDIIQSFSPCVNSED